MYPNLPDLNPPNGTNQNPINIQYPQIPNQEGLSDSEYQYSI